MTVWSVCWRLSFSVQAVLLTSSLAILKISDLTFMLSRLNLAPGAALRYREKGKITAYDSLAKDAGSRFVPFAFETFGGLAPTAIGFLRDLETYARGSLV